MDHKEREKLEETTLIDAPEDLSAELLELLLDETERALLLVDARVDEPGRRVEDGDSPEDLELEPSVRQLRLAMAETIDGNPSIQWELERVSERLRSVGASAAAGELSAHPQVLDLGRLAIESFFSQFPKFETFECTPTCDDYAEETGRNPREVYEAMAELKTSLRSRMS